MLTTECDFLIFQVVGTYITNYALWNVNVNTHTKLRAINGFYWGKDAENICCSIVYNALNLYTNDENEPFNCLRLTKKELIDLLRIEDKFIYVCMTQIDSIRNVPHIHRCVRQICQSLCRVLAWPHLIVCLFCWSMHYLAWVRWLILLEVITPHAFHLDADDAVAVIANKFTLIKWWCSMVP